MTKHSGLAVASLILGIFALLLGWIPFVGFIIVLLAIILGFVAIRKIGKDPELTGKGMAIAGIIMGFLGLLWTLFIILGAIAYFGVLNPTMYLPDRCMVQGGFSCVDYKVDGDADQVRFHLINNLGVPVDSLTVRMTGDCTGTTSFGKIENRAEEQVTFNCPLESEEAFQGTLDLVYVKTGETESHTASGTLTGMAE